MTTIISPNELVRRAAVFVAEERQAHPQRPLSAILDEAGMRFNLNPLDSAALQRLFSEDATD